ncbi:MAG: Sodium - Bile acid symporter [Rhodospirillales bacterium]|nr:Sodium - Bile acid symporter [Rhodospirillales bacterium]
MKAHTEHRGVEDRPSGRPRLKPRLPIDPFIVGLITAVILATILPCRGEGAVVFGAVTNLAIALLFFLHGAKLSREAILDGIGNWRLHLTVLASSFIMFPLIGLGLRAGLHNWVSAPMLDGVLFLCLLPSTVQSSIAFTSIARGNVPAAVCSASASNVIGIFITPLLVGLLLAGQAGTSRSDGVSLSAVGAILLQLLAPFILGHLSRPLIVHWIGRHKAVVNLVDRGSILLVVYTAFSAAIVEGLWNQLSLGDLAIVALLDALVLFFALFATTFGARWLGFNRADEIAIVFCGSKKSLASGVPMASVLFPAAAVGLMILPLMLFHQMQLMVCAMLARRYAAADRNTG